MRSKRYIATGLLVGLTAGAGAGFTMSQGGIAGAAGTAGAVGAVGAAAAVVAPVDTTGTDDDAGTSDSTGRPTREERLAAVLAPLVEDGTISQAQADAVIAALDAAAPILGRGHGPHGRFGRGLRVALETVADALGTTVEELRDSLADGATIRELATEAGVDPQAVVDAIVAQARTALDARVAAGDLTQQEADAKLAALTLRATELLDATGPLGRGRGPRSDEGHEADEEETTDTSVSDTDGTSGTVEG